MKSSTGSGSKDWERCRTTIEYRPTLWALIVLICMLNALPSTPAASDSLVLDDTATVFDGSMFGGNGCDGEFPLASCRYYNMGGFSVIDIGKNIVHGSSEYRTLMGFDFSELPDHDSIEVDSAILTLTVYYAVNPDTILHFGCRSLSYNVIEGNSQIYKNATDSSFTWSARIFKDDVDTVKWQIGGAGGVEDREDSIYAVSPGIGDAGEYRIDVAGLLRHWIDSSATERWCLLADTAGIPKPYARKIICSSEYPVPSMRPRLEIFFSARRSGEQGRKNVLCGGLIR